MTISKLDIRFPEKHLSLNKPDCTSEELEHAKSLGKKYRLAKKVMKLQADEKRVISKKVAELKLKNIDTKKLVEEVKDISKQSKNTKATLKNLEKSIRDLIETQTHEIPTLPPQFSPKYQSNELLSEKIFTSIMEKIDEEEWTRYIQNHPNATIYHTLKTRQVISDSFSHQSLYLIARNQNSQICGALPIFRLNSRVFGDLWISVPFFNYGGVIADNPAIESSLMDYAGKLIERMGSDHIEYRHSHPIDNLPCREDKVSMVLALPEDSNNLWQQLGSKLRAQIKKSQANDAHVITGREELVDDFYQVFSHNMRDLGTPVYSKELFINMLLQHPSANISIVYMHKKAVAAGFTLGWRNTLEIPWASTLRDANQYNVNMRLYWHLLELAINQGYKNFDFGRSSKDATTYKFKKQWGAQPQQLYWHYWLPDQTELSPITTDSPRFKLAIKIWQLLPIWLTKILGPSIVKNIP